MMRKMGKKASIELEKIATIVIILVVIVVVVVIFINQMDDSSKYIKAVKSCESLGGKCVTEGEVQDKRNEGYLCTETCGEENPTPYCCYKSII